MPTHQTNPPLGRDNWKARTRTEGDSKAPSLSIASSTCRKAGARGKHTRNVGMIPGSLKRVLEGKKVTVPKNGHACKNLYPMPATGSAEEGQPLKLKEEQPNGKSHSSSFFSILGVTKTPMEQEKGKKESQAPQPPLHPANWVRRRQGRRAIPSREKDTKVIAHSEPGADSKAPSVSIASSTCRKAGARGKHTRNVGMIPGSLKRVLEGKKVTVPKNGHACKNLYPMPATGSAEEGQPLKLKEEQPNGKSHSSSFFSILGVTKTPMEQEKGKKREPSSPAASPSS